MSAQLVLIRVTHTHTHTRLAQSAGAVEYINYISVEDLDPSPNECPLYDIKQSDGKRNAEYPFYCHHSQVHSGPEW